MCCRSLVASGSHRLALVRRPRWLRGRRAERGFALPHTACDCTPLGQTASSAPCLPPVPAARRKAPSWKAPSSACHNCGYPGGLDVWLRAWAALRTLEERPSPPDPSGSTPCGPQTVPQSPSSAPHPILSTVPPASYPSLHILSSPPPDSTSYHNPITPLLWRGSGAGPNARARRCSCCSSAACCPEAAHRPRRLRRRQRRAPAPLRARQTPRRPGVACPTAWPKCEDDRPLRRSGACAQSLTAAFDHIQVRGSWPVRGARTN